MKFFTLTLCIVTVLSFSSCNNDDEDAFDFTGTWKLVSLSAINYSNEIDLDLTTRIEPDENCLDNRFLTINPDGTATISSSSELEVEVQLIDGTSDEFEQQINCIEIESTATYSWATGDYSVTNPDGSVTTGSSAGYDTIRLLDENNDIYISGFVTPGNESTITFLRNPNPNENNTIVVDGETIEIAEFRGFVYKKQ